jgi:hypothetical protein
MSRKKAQKNYKSPEKIACKRRNSRERVTGGDRGTLFLKFGRVGLAAAAIGCGRAAKIYYIIKLIR